jgi:hypothetical protein
MLPIAEEIAVHDRNPSESSRAGRKRRGSYQRISAPPRAKPLAELARVVMLCSVSLLAGMCVALAAILLFMLLTVLLATNPAALEAPLRTNALGGADAGEGAGRDHAPGRPSSLAPPASPLPTSPGSSPAPQPSAAISETQPIVRPVANTPPSPPPLPPSPSPWSPSPLPPTPHSPPRSLPPSPPPPCVPPARPPSSPPIVIASLRSAEMSSHIHSHDANLWYATRPTPACDAEMLSCRHEPGCQMHREPTCAF